MLKFRSKQVVDSCVGVDGEDAQNSTLTGDRGIYISGDGQRRTEELLNLAHKKRRIRLRPSGLKDSLAEWKPVADEDIESEVADQITGRKRKRFDSDDPMKEWRPHQQLFLGETTCHHGLGDSTCQQECAICEKDLSDGKTRFFRCSECGVFLQCEACCLKHHRLTPLHFLEEWKDDHWQKATLTSLGLIYQIGHEGRRCPRPEAVVRTMVVIDKTGVHRVRYRYCACKRKEHANELQQLLRTGWYPATVTDPTTCATFRVLDFFRLMNVVGNVNANDFITALERLSDATVSSGLNPVPDRYKQFIRMARQWAFLQRARRAGRANDPEGLAATLVGQMMVICWACPYDGRNLPTDWRDVDPRYAFLYMLLLAIDANFKLKNRIRKNETYDPSLGPGYGAFVHPTPYKEHLKGYVGEKDINTCIAFAALLQKDTRNTVGLRVSGVGGCVCARHECMRPNGLGDLQKGERYPNMDYIVMSSLRGFNLTHLTLSYDIACQWKKGLPDRMQKLPSEIQLIMQGIELQCGLPVWHASSHEESCRNNNSLSFLVGVGKTDGEGVERFWSKVNQVSYFTKNASLGSRADALEDSIDSNNYLKNIGQGESLLRKLIIAVAERARQVACFEEVDGAIRTSTRTEWQTQIDNFLADRTLPNPYVLPAGEGPTEVDIRLELKREEEKDARIRGMPLRATSATAFLVAGLQLEQSQRRISAESAGLALVTANRESRIHDMRLSFFAKLRTFRNLQEIYMPGAIRAVKREDERRDTDAEPPKAEAVKLWMPSEFEEEEERGEACQSGLGDMEAKLREAQCSDALLAIRSRLHTKRHLIGFRDQFITGQNDTTKARKLIDVVGDRVNTSEKKYTRARGALSVLKGKDHAPHFKVLKREDLTLDGELGDKEVAARKKLALAGVGKRNRLPRHLEGSTRKTLSWIWTAVNATFGPEDEPHLHEAVRVEWSRAKARKKRWEEEVTLIREEMRRVLRYLEWQSGWWDERAEEAASHSKTPEMAGALRGYAVKQALLHRDLEAHFKRKWGQSMHTAALDVLSTEAGAELNEFFGQGECSSKLYIVIA
ncbi:hypothetical protein C8R43DRAFT_1137919 [Mycena crocata]|nr:hypothetical protein C8R43DRAFT_1137919 [Mycena crocata]